MTEAQKRRLYEVVICQVRSVHSVALNMLRGHLQNLGHPQQQLAHQKVISNIRKASRKHNSIQLVLHGYILLKG